GERGWTFAGPWYSNRSKTRAGVMVDEELALTYGAVWAATRILSEGVSDRDLITYQRDYVDEENGQRENRREAIGTAVYELLRHFPNPQMGSTTFRGGRVMHQVNMGNAFAEIERKNPIDPWSEPVALWPIHPGRVKPSRAGDTYAD